MGQESNKELKTLYESLRRDNYDVPATYDSFERTLTATDKDGLASRKALYESLKRDNYDVPATYESFDRTLFAPAQPAAAAKPAASSTSAAAQGRPAATAAGRQVKAGRVYTMRSGGVDFYAPESDVVAAGGFENWSRANNPGADTRVYMRNKKGERRHTSVGNVKKYVSEGWWAEAAPAASKKAKVSKGRLYTLRAGGRDFTVSEDAVVAAGGFEAYGAKYYPGQELRVYMNTPQGRRMHVSAGEVKDRAAKGWYAVAKGKQTERMAMYSALREQTRKNTEAMIRMASERAREFDKQNSWNDEESGWDNFVRIAGGAAKRSVTANAPVPEQNLTARDQEAKDRLAERAILDEAAQTLRAQNLRKSDGWLGGIFDVSNNLKNFTVGVLSKMRDPDLYAQGVVALHNNERLDRINDKLKRGESLTDSEKSLAMALLLKSHAESSGDTPAMYRAGQTTTEMVPFFIQMAANPASGLTKGLVKQYGKTMVKRMGKQVLKKKAYKVGKAAVTLAGDVTESAVLANTLQAPATVADIRERHRGELRYDGEDFKFEGGESWAKAIAKGQGAAVIENYTELLGGHLPGLGKWIGKRAGKVAGKAGLGKAVDRVSSLIRNVKASDWGKAVAAIESRAQWNGTVGEILEEEAGVVLNSLFVGDNSLSDLIDSRTQIDIVLGVGMFGGFMSGIKTGGAMAGRLRARRSLRRQDRAGEWRFGQDWAEIRDAVDQAEDGDVAGTVSSMIEKHAKSMEQARTIAGYAQSLMKARGYNLAQLKKSEEPGEQQREAMAENELEQTYEAGEAAAEGGVDASSLSEAQGRMNEARDTFIREFGDEAELYMKQAEESPWDLLKDERLSEGQREAALAYINAKAAWEGIRSGSEDGAAGVYEQGREVYARYEQGDESAQVVADAIAERMREAYDEVDEAFGAEAEYYRSLMDEDPWSLMDDPELTEAQKDTILYYINAKSAMDGVLDASGEAAESRRAEVLEGVERRTHRDSGVILPATMKVDDRPVYIVKGNVVMFEDGSGVDVRNSSESVVVTDAQTGEYEFTSPDQIFQVSEAVDPQEEVDTALEAIEQERMSIFSENGEGVGEAGENSLTLQSETDNGNGEGLEQSNDGSDDSSRDDGGSVAADAAGGVAEDRDRSDIRVYEEGLGTPRDAHTEYSERNRREAESERLVGIAKANGGYRSRAEVRALGIRNRKSTGESEVIIDKDGGVVYKIKDPYAKSPMKGDVQPEDAIYEHLVHNKYFPETAYTFEGISDELGDVRIVLSQKFVASVGQPTQEQIEAALAEKGLYPEGKYTFGNEEVSVTDVTGDNALLGADGKVYFIDPIINFKKPVREILDGGQTQDGLNDVPDKSNKPYKTDKANVTDSAGADSGQTALSRIPLNEDGEPAFEAVDSETGWDGLVKAVGGKAKAALIAAEQIKLSTAALEALQKKPPTRKTPKLKGSPMAMSKAMDDADAQYEKDLSLYNQQLAEAQARIEAWNGIVSVCNSREAEQLRQREEERRQRDAIAHDKAVARFEEEQRIKAEKQAEQERIGVHAVNPKIKEKWDAAPKVEGNEDALTLPDGSTISGRYVLTEAGAASPSHDANNGYVPTEGFPIDENGQSVNDRDYFRDKDAQQKVEGMASSYDNRALQDPVIVSKDGVVMSGNNRTMSGDLAARRGTDKAYVDYLAQFGHRKYGFTPEQVTGMKNPRVVFVPDEALPYDATTFARFNAQEKKSQGKPEAAVKLGKIVPDNVFNVIVNDISRYDRLSDYYADEKAVAQALGALMQAGVINDMQMPELRTGTALSAAGKELIENTLIGKVFQASPDAVRQIISVPVLRQSIVMGLSEIANNRTLARNGYDISDELSKAVDLVARAKTAMPDVYTDGMPVSPFGRMQGLFDDEFGDSRVTDATTLLLADILNSGKPSDLRKVLTTYNNEAAQASGGQIDIFSGSIPTKEEILTTVNEHFRNATPKEQQALVDTAIAERKRRAEADAEQRERSEASEQTPHDDERGAEPQQPVAGDTEFTELEPLGKDRNDLYEDTPEEAALRARISVDEEWEEEGPAPDKPIYRRKLYVDGKHEVIQTDAPDKNGSYTGSQLTFDGRDFGDLKEVADYIDNSQKASASSQGSVAEDKSVKPIEGNGMIGRSLTEQEATELITRMESAAEVAPELELTIENWDAQFGIDGKITTPIGAVKMGEHQFAKLMRHGRNGKLGMIKPTLENPYIIIEDGSVAKEGEVSERSSSYVFVKSFRKSDGSRYYHFTSITVSKDGKEVVISSQEKSRNRILRLMQEGSVVWCTPKDATTSSAEKQGLDYEQPDKAEATTKGSGITPQNIPSDRKVNTFSANSQINKGQSDFVDTSADKQTKSAESSEPYTITATAYTNKKGNTSDVLLVKFNRELTAEEKAALDTFAREPLTEGKKTSRGWYDRKQGGYMMRSEEAARQLSEMIGNEEAVADAQPMTAEELREAVGASRTRNSKPKKAPINRVSLEDVMTDLSAKGETKLSGHAEPIKAEPEQQHEISDDEMQSLADELRDLLGIGDDEGDTNIKFRDPGELTAQERQRIQSAGLRFAMGLVERGTTFFPDYAAKMVGVFGDKIRPWLKSFYEGARWTPGYDKYTFTPTEQVATFDVQNFDKKQADPIAQAAMIVEERKASTVSAQAQKELTETRNKNRRENDKQTEADTAALAEKAEAVAGEAEVTAQSAGTGEAGRKRILRDLKRVNDTIDEVNDQLAILGYYEAEEVDKDFNEAYGYMRNAEKKAVKDAVDLAKQLVNDLGLGLDKVTGSTTANRGKKKNAVTANIAPAGGDVSIRLPLNEGRELYISIGIDPSVKPGDVTYKGDNLQATRIMYRVEWPDEKGHVPVNHMGRNCWAEADVTYGDLLKGIQSEAKEYLPSSTPAEAEKGHNGYKVGDEVLWDRYGNGKWEKQKIVDFEKDGRPILDSFGQNWITEIVDWERIKPADGIFGEAQRVARAEQEKKKKKATADAVATLTGNKSKKSRKKDVTLKPEQAIGGLFADLNEEPKNQESNERSGNKPSKAVAEREFAHSVGADASGTDGRLSSAGAEPADKRRAADEAGTGVERGVDRPAHGTDENGGLQPFVGNRGRDESRTDSRSADTGVERGRAAGAGSVPARSADRGAERLSAGESAAGTGSGSGSAAIRKQKRPEVKYTQNFRYDEENGNEADTYTPSQRLEANVKAIETLADVLFGNAPALDEQKAIMSRFRGWGQVDLGKYYDVDHILRNTSENAPINRLAQVIKRLDPSGDKKLYEAIKRASLSSYYTPTPIARAINSFLALAGYKGGSLLDPSMGNGMFEGTLPKSIQERTSITGVELDWLSGQLSRALYPDANVMISAFEKSGIAPGSFDVVTSNVPFGDIAVNDPTWKNDSTPLKRAAQNRIHNYYAVKILEATRPGGLVAIMTTSAVMDTHSNQNIRAHIADQGEILGAIRLPDNTFQGTGVVTDIIFVRKWRDEQDRKQTRADESYMETERAFLSQYEKAAPNKLDGSKQLVRFNGYYKLNPRNMIGEIQAGNQYGKADAFGLTSKMTVDEIASEVEKAIKRIVGNRRGSLFNPARTTRETRQAIREEYKGDGDWVSNGNLVVQDGKVGVLTAKSNEYGEVTRTFEGTQKHDRILPRIKAMIDVRTSMKKLIAAQIEGEREGTLASLRGELQKAYDNYVGKFGRLQDKSNAFILDDIDGYTLQALEIWKNDKFEGLSDIFTKNSIKSSIKLEGKKSPQEAVALSLAEYGYLRPDYLAKALGEDWVEQCGDVVFLKPNSVDDYVTRDEYLSGDVVTKLAEARAVAGKDKSFERNVKALEEVQPERIPFDDITIHLGARWIPEEVLNDFVSELLGIHAVYSNRNRKWDPELGRYVSEQKSGVRYIPETDSFEINIEKKELGGEASDWETPKKSAKEILKAALEDKSLVITYKDKDGITHVDDEQTELANQKIADLRERFETWLPSDPARVDLLEQIYNDRFNRTRIRHFDGSHLVVPGLMGKELRPHQKDAVWMLINNRGGIVDHIVGAGKTLVMQSAIMEMRRMGIAKKPMIVALKSTVAQIAREFKESFPSARVLAPNDKDFKKENRKKFIANISLNDYDCVILSHEQYCMLPHTEEAERAVIDEQMWQLDNMIEYLYGTNDTSQMTKKQIKALEKRRENLKAKLEKRLDRAVDREFCFENLGVDYLFVDESHQFKALPYVTSYQKVAGLGDPQGSNRAVALLTGIRHLQRMHQGDKGTVFLSGTTITNSLVETYNLLNYLRPRKLEELGMPTFDAWASTFAVHTAELEATITGGFALKDRFRQFDNVGELSQLYAEIADVRNDQNLKLPKPGIDAHTVIVPASDAISEINSEIVNMIESKDGKYFGIYPHDPSRAPWGLHASTISAKAAVSPRLVFPEMNDDGGKVHAVCENVKKYYDEMTEQRGVQLIFCEMGVPGKGKEYDAYTDMVNRFVNDYGIPRSEIAYIQEAPTEEKRKDLFQRVRDGNVRILIGGTKNMGTGVNVQDRITDMHMLTVPWTPAALEQCIGRGGRQGNLVARDFMSNKVRVHYYATEGSLDLYKYQLLDAKGKMITQFKMGTVDGIRSFDEGSADEDGNMDPAEMVAILSGNPVIFEKAKQEKVVKKLRALRNGFERDYQRKKAKYEELQRRKENIERLIRLNDRDSADLERNGFKPNDKGVYPSTVTINDTGSYYGGGRTFDKPKEAGEYLLAALDKGKDVTLQGFGQRAKVATVNEEKGNSLFSFRELQIGDGDERSIRYSVRLSNDATAAGTAYRNLLKRIMDVGEAYRRELEAVNSQLTGMNIGDGIFPKQAEYDEVTAKLKELTAEFNKLGKKQMPTENGLRGQMKLNVQDASKIVKSGGVVRVGGDCELLISRTPGSNDCVLLVPNKSSKTSLLDDSDFKNLQKRRSYFKPEKIYCISFGDIDNVVTVLELLKSKGFTLTKSEEDGKKYRDGEEMSDGERLRAIRALEPIAVERNEMSREELREVYNNLPSVEKDGMEIEFYRSAFKKIYKEGGLFGQVVPVLDDVLEQSVLAYSEEDNLGGMVRPDGTVHKEHPNVDSFDNYVGKVRIDGKEYYVRTTVAVQPGQSGMHAVFVSDIDLYENTARSLSYPGSPRARVTSDGIVDAKLQQFFERASSEANILDMRDRVEALSERSGIPVRVVTDASELSETSEDGRPRYSRRERRAKGWWSAKDDEVVIVLPNNVNVADVDNTFVHEVVGHKGLRALVGEEHFDEFLDEIYGHASNPVSKIIDKMTGRMVDEEADRLRTRMAQAHERAGEDVNANYYTDMAEARLEAEKKRKAFRREATEEYMSDLGGRIGSEGFERMSREELTFWGRVKAKVQAFLDRFLRGLKIAKSIRLSDKDLSYILYKSWKNLRNRKRQGGVFAEAEDAVLRRRTGWDERMQVSEKRARIEKLRRSAPVIVTDEMIPERVDLKDRKAVQKSLRETIRGEYVNEYDGRTLEVSGKGINEVTHHGMTDEAHVKSLYAIPEMLRKSIYIDSRRNEKSKNDFEEYRYYVCGLKIGEDDYTAKIVVGVKNGHSYYDHRLSHIEKGKLIDSLNAFSNGVAENESPSDGYKGTTLESLLQISDEENADVKRFRDPGLGLEEYITKMKAEAMQANTDNLQAKRDAMRAIGGNLNHLRQAMAKQREYDITTVKSVADLARVLLDNNLLDDLSKYETKRILGAINNVVGKQDVSRYVQKVMDIMVDNQLRMGANALGKLLSIRGSRVDARGIEVQGEVFAEAEDAVMRRRTGYGEPKLRSMTKAEKEAARAEAVADRIEALFDEAVSGKLTGKPVDVGRLTADGKAYLERLSGMKLKDEVSFVLNPSDLVHIYRRHYGANEMDNRNIPLTHEDIRQMAEIIVAPDRVVFGKEKGGNERNMFFFLKGTGDGSYNLMEIYSDKKGNLTAKSFFKSKEGVSQRAMLLSESSTLTSVTDGATLFDGAKLPKFFEYPTSEREEMLRFRTALSFKKVLCFRKACYFIAGEV